MDPLANRDFSFDIGTLLHPLSEANPSGESLRYDAIYDDIREARREDDPVEERGIWIAPLKKADWDTVEELCRSALQKRTKDLQIAAWLMEAWLRHYGLPGMRDGLRLMNALSREFWDTIHPLPEDDDMEYRVAPFEWANEKLSVLLRLVLITNPRNEDLRPLTLSDWENACRPSLHDPQASGPDDKITQGEFKESLDSTPTADLGIFLDLTDEATNAMNKLNVTLDEKCAERSPGLGQIASALAGIRSVVHTAYIQRPKADSAKAPKSMETVRSAMLENQYFKNEEAIDDLGITAPGGPIRTRTEAYRQLTEAADFLIRTEPHSPVPYLVKRAIAWGNMNLEALLPQLVRNNSELSEIYRLLQIGRVDEP
jgi:type VI secretion system protein ImpA